MFDDTWNAPNEEVSNALRELQNPTYDLEKTFENAKLVFESMGYSQEEAHQHAIAIMQQLIVLMGGWN